MTAWDLVSGNPQAEKNLEITWPKLFIPLKEGTNYNWDQNFRVVGL